MYTNAIHLFIRMYVLYYKDFQISISCKFPMENYINDENCVRFLCLQKLFNFEIQKLVKAQFSDARSQF